MLIGKKYQIVSDHYNYTLQIRKKKKNGGDEYWYNEAYYPSLHYALSHLVELEVRETELVDLKTVMNKMAELYYLVLTVRDERIPPKDKTKKGRKRIG